MPLGDQHQLWSVSSESSLWMRQDSKQRRSLFPESKDDIMHHVNIIRPTNSRAWEDTACQAGPAIRVGLMIFPGEQFGFAWVSVGSSGEKERWVACESLGAHFSGCRENVLQACWEISLESMNLVYCILTVDVLGMNEQMQRAWGPTVAAHRTGRGAGNPKRNSQSQRY